MVCFSPFKRISAEECLKNPYFDDIRDSKFEQAACREVVCVNSFKSRDEAAEFLKNEI